ncbi:hypothetical protein F5Y18DRAFT_428592 [Xylariaceae sp. FL1019]|nr:hypothetical protein F5Y18DRAFT_428592 [Xylariaceae sp. FL1019]
MAVKDLMARTAEIKRWINMWLEANDKTEAYRLFIFNYSNTVAFTPNGQTTITDEDKQSLRQYMKDHTGVCLDVIIYTGELLYHGKSHDSRNSPLDDDDSTDSHDDGSTASHDDGSTDSEDHESMDPNRDDSTDSEDHESMDPNRDDSTDSEDHESMDPSRDDSTDSEEDESMDS